jgi:hypothetical protein
MIAVACSGGAAASGAGDIVPRFSLAATAATPDDEVALRVEQSPRLPQREIRLYLVPVGAATTVRSRLDPRLSFIGSVRALPRARLVFTVPPLEPGRYALAYWCRGCVPLGRSLAVQRSPTLSVAAPAGEGCPATKPNRKAPPGVQGSSTIFDWHGNGALWVFLRPDGTLVTNALGGWKQIWVAKPWASGSLLVRYRRLDEPSPPIAAQVVSGTLGGYGGPSWASRMSFQPGCWQITGRLGDATLSFVAQVVFGNG